MSEDIGNLEADLEALMAALELAGTLAERSRHDALRLMRHLHKDPPRSREEWANRAQLLDANGQDLGWLDTSQARRVDLADTTGARDRGVDQKPASAGERRGPGELVELEGQFFEVHTAAGKGVPEHVRPISQEEAQARIKEHRPDLRMRVLDAADGRVEITRADSNGWTRGTSSAHGDAAQRAGVPTPVAAAGPSDRVGWDDSAQASPGASAAGRRSAAEAFGAVDQPRQRERAETPAGAPSEAELSAVGATKSAETSLSR